MAEALLEVVLENLNYFLQKEFASFLGIKEEMEKLADTLTTIQAVLKDAEEQQITNHALKVWLQNLKNAACVLDDILDECSIKFNPHEFQGQNVESSNKVNSSFSLSSFIPNNLLFRYKIGKRIKEMRERLNQISEDRHKFHLREVFVERPTEVAEWRQTSSIITQPQVYGRDEDREKIMEFLLRNAGDIDDALFVYPIVGIGGIGKTTLAQLVYNDERVSRHFDLKIWVCVSEKFSTMRILQSIIGSISTQNYNNLNLDPMQKQVQELLRSKKYLLVLDDVWNESQDQWDGLKHVLACGSKGASILVTTRLAKVAAIMGSVPAQPLSSLCEEDCWSLFRQRASGPDREVRPELVPIGKDIVKKCGGLPLAAKALGGLMRFKSTKKEWLHVKDSELWNLPEDENSIMPALRLSYFNLPFKLRQCFAFCAVFPKDNEIWKEKLIHFWMANGFISSKGRLAVEDVGSEVWNELYQRSFFQDAKIDEIGNVISFKMHDLVYDLAHSIMGEEYLVWNDATFNNLSRSTHHIGFSDFHESFLTSDLKKVESLRTIIQSFSPASGISFKSPAFRSLRVLSARCFQLSSLKHLIHLRYLDVSDTNIRALPKSIYSLQKLQTLKLDGCGFLLRLPKHLNRLHNLRHLFIKNCYSLSHMPPKIGELTSLKSLSTFIVGSEIRNSIAELHDLDLGGELHIKALENVGTAFDAKGANLIAKTDLQCLRLSWGRSNNNAGSHTTNVEQILEALQPHTNLKSLEIENYGGRHLPNWMIDSSFLHSLVALSLHNFNNCQELPPLGKLPSLRSLSIDGMENVRYIDKESYDNVTLTAFMSLEMLYVHNLPNLEKLLKEEGVQMFPCLSELSISVAPKFRLPCLPSVKQLYIMNCNEESLRSISDYQGLTSLELWSSDSVELASFPEGLMRNFTCLKTLHISYFNKLKVLPTELFSLIALEELWVTNCSQLESFPEQVLEGLSSLRTLWIINCENLGTLSEGIQQLSSLENLQISGCPKLMALPKGMNQLTCLRVVTISGQNPECVFPEGLERTPFLQSLNIKYFSNLTSLPDSLGDLTSLQYLFIHECPKLTTLPASIQRLTNLQEVHISMCPELQNLYKRETWDIVCGLSRSMTWSEYSKELSKGRKSEGMIWRRKGQRNIV